MEDGLTDLCEMIDSLDIDAENDPEECFMKAVLSQMEAVRKYKNTTFVFYRMLMEEENVARYRKHMMRRFLRFWIEFRTSGIFEKNIPGSGSSIVLEEPSCTS